MNDYFSSGFLLVKNQVLRVLIGWNRQLLFIKIYAGISKLPESNKGNNQMLFLVFLNFRKVSNHKHWLI